MMLVPDHISPGYQKNRQLLHSKSRYMAPRVDVVGCVQLLLCLPNVGELFARVYMPTPHDSTSKLFIMFSPKIETLDRDIVIVIILRSFRAKDR